MIVDVPFLELPWAIGCAILNLIFPGIGTLVAACASNTETTSKTQLMVGALQFMTTPFLFL